MAPAQKKAKPTTKKKTAAPARRAQAAAPKKAAVKAPASRSKAPAPRKAKPSKPVAPRKTTAPRKVTPARKTASKAPAKIAVKRPAASRAVRPPARTAPVKRSTPARVPDHKWTAAELRNFRAILQEEEIRLLSEVHDLEERSTRAGSSEAPVEMSGYEDHPADLASETFEREKDLALEENIRNLLGRVRSALEKIDQRTYGYCDACGDPIAKNRLQALPFATLCLECQARLER